MALITYAPWGVRVRGLVESRKIPTQQVLPLFFASAADVPKDTALLQHQRELRGEALALRQESLAFRRRVQHKDNLDLVTRSVKGSKIKGGCA